MMKPRTPAAPSDFAIRDVVYAEHYGRRIASAVNQQILHFSKEITLAMLRAYPEGSSEYFVVVEAIHRAGAGLLHPLDASPSSSEMSHHPRDQDSGSRPIDRPQAQTSPDDVQARSAKADLRGAPALPARDQRCVLDGPWPRG